METPMEATPRPWTIEKCDRWKRSCYIKSASGLRIGYAYSDIQKMHRGEPEANAALIVRAVNSFDDLVAALDEAIVLIEFFHGRAGWSEYQQSPEMKRIRAALKKAGK